MYIVFYFCLTTPRVRLVLEEFRSNTQSIVPGTVSRTQDLLQYVSLVLLMRAAREVLHPRTAIDAKDILESAAKQPPTRPPLPARPAALPPAPSPPTPVAKEPADPAVPGAMPPPRAPHHSPALSGRPRAHTASAECTSSTPHATGPAGEGSEGAQPRVPIGSPAASATPVGSTPSEPLSGGSDSPPLDSTTVTTAAAIAPPATAPQPAAATACSSSTPPPDDTAGQLPLGTLEAAAPAEPPLPPPPSDPAAPAAAPPQPPPSPALSAVGSLAGSTALDSEDGGAGSAGSSRGGGGGTGTGAAGAGSRGTSTILRESSSHSLLLLSPAPGPAAHPAGAPLLTMATLPPSPPASPGSSTGRAALFASGSTSPPVAGASTTPTPIAPTALPTLWSPDGSPLPAAAPILVGAAGYSSGTHSRPQHATGLWVASGSSPTAVPAFEQRQSALPAAAGGAAAGGAGQCSSPDIAPYGRGAAEADMRDESLREFDMSAPRLLPPPLLLPPPPLPPPPPSADPGGLIVTSDNTADSGPAASAPLSDDPARHDEGSADPRAAGAVAPSLSNSWSTNSSGPLIDMAMAGAAAGASDQLSMTAPPAGTLREALQAAWLRAPGGSSGSGGCGPGTSPASSGGGSAGQRGGHSDGPLEVTTRATGGVMAHSPSDAPLLRHSDDARPAAVVTPLGSNVPPEVCGKGHSGRGSAGK